MPVCRTADGQQSAECDEPDKLLPMGRAISPAMIAFIHIQICTEIFRFSHSLMCIFLPRYINIDIPGSRFHKYRYVRTINHSCFSSLSRDMKPVMPVSVYVKRSRVLHSEDHLFEISTWSTSDVVQTRTRCRGTYRYNSTFCLSD